MNLFEFAETADDHELNTWYTPGVSTTEQFKFVHESGSNRPILWTPTELDRGYQNNCSPEVARMYFQFVALATDTVACPVHVADTEHADEMNMKYGERYGWDWQYESEVEVIE
jgi:hypothetical protein